MNWDRDRALDDAPSDLDVEGWDGRCVNCGALYDFPIPVACPLCGSEQFEPVGDLAW